MKAIRVEILGPIRATCSGTDLAVGGPVDRAVLGLVAAHPGERVPVTRILACAYPGIDRRSARKALHTAVWRLRRAFEGTDLCLVTDHGGYRLDLGDATTDAEACRAALRAAAASEPDALERLTAAAAAWGGGRSEVPGRDGTVLDELICDTVHATVRQLVAAGRSSEARGHLERLATAFPDRAPADLLDASTSTAGHADDIGSDELAELAVTVESLSAILGPATMAELVATTARWIGADPGDGATVFDAVGAGVRAGHLEATTGPNAVTIVTPLAPAVARLEPLPDSLVFEKHRVAAEALTQLYGHGRGPHLHRVAHHMSAAVPAVDATVALDALEAAARHDLRDDPKAAATSFERALAINDEWTPWDRARRLRLLLWTGRALEAAGRPADATAAWEQLVAEAETIGDHAAAAAAALELAGTVWRPRDYPPAADMLDRSLAGLAVDDELRGPVVLRRIQLQRFGRGGDPRVHTRVATDRVLLAGLHADDAAGRATVALVQWVAAVEEGVGTVDDDPDTAAVIDAAGDNSTLRLQADRWHITRAIAQGRFNDAIEQLGRLAVRIPEWEAVARTAVQRDELSRARHASRVQLATVRLYQGRMAEAAEIVVEPDDDGVHDLIFDVRALTALYRGRTGQTELARRLLADVLDDLWSRPDDRFRFGTAVSAAFVAADLGDREPIDRLCVELEPWRGRHCLLGFAGYSGVTEHALGRMRSALGELDEADVLLDAAIAAHDRVGAVVFATLSRAYRADVLERMGGHERRGDAVALRRVVADTYATFA